MNASPTKISPVDRRSTSDVIADQLRERIVDGTLEPGSQLGEVAIAEQLGVSRGPVREAMQRLIQEGLLVSEPYRGVFVLELDEDDVADIYAARAAIERAAALTITRNHDAEAVLALTELVDKMRAAVSSKRPSWNRVVELDLAFHETLVAHGGSSRLVRMYGTLVAETRLCFAAMRADYPDWNDVVAEHEQLIDAFERGDEAAVLAAVDDHLRQAAARRTSVSS